MTTDDIAHDPDESPIRTDPDDPQKVIALRFLGTQESADVIEDWLDATGVEHDEVTYGDPDGVLSGYPLVIGGKPESRRVLRNYLIVYPGDWVCIDDLGEIGLRLRIEQDVVAHLERRSAARLAKMRLSYRAIKAGVLAGKPMEGRRVRKVRPVNLFNSYNVAPPSWATEIIFEWLEILTDWLELLNSDIESRPDDTYGIAGLRDEIAAVLEALGHEDFRRYIEFAAVPAIAWHRLNPAALYPAVVALFDAYCEHFDDGQMEERDACLVAFADLARGWV